MFGKSRNTHCKNEYCKLHGISAVRSLVKFGLDESKIGTTEIFEEINRIKTILLNLYVGSELSTIDIASLFNCKVHNVTDAFKSLNINLRNSSDSIYLAIKHDRFNLPSNVFLYKDEWHKTWDDNIVYLRSSYETDFANILELDGEIEDIDFVDYAIDVKNLISEIGETSKKHECIDLIETLIKQEKKLVVWCIFVDSIISIKHALELKGIKAETVWGEVPLDYRLDIINRFKANEIDVLITNPHTLAESVSLHTVCHDAIYYEYSYNLVHLLQSKDRIHRLGLPENQYTQYYFIQNEYDLFDDVYSLDNEIYERLLLKEQRMLDAIDNQELEPVYTPEEDLDLIFEKLF